MKRHLDLIIRYLIIVLVAIPNLYLFYAIFTPLTLYPIYFILNLFFDVTLEGISLILNGFQIHIIEACVAGAAYYLLFALNMSVPGIKIKKRATMIGFSFLSLLILNILRILILMLVLFYGASFFDITHKFFWYFLSTLLVVLIWFAEVKLFKIKQIPVYTDMMYLYKKSNLKKHKKSKASK
jgi:exosortase/archaeosortase family protein